MISIHADVDSNKLRGFGTYAGLLLHNAVEDGVRDGANHMRSVVPRGKGTLASAVKGTGPLAMEPGHYVGVVGVDPAIAPHAEHVNKGTGIDGPHKSSVRVHGQSARNPRKQHVMRFTKRGEPPRYRREVKFMPSQAIQRNKGFARSTYIAMREWARARTIVMSTQLAAYFKRP